ncbi:D-alanine--D-alanine ligase [Anaeromyxobacter dehalogenans 2CP-1]|uniref:D-alanine--D-alanine ligase n=1 Tax=Anaeromyxobacter dehalogenans (strain ATCC BAA-258 / DSM 21875 / 2CP-1) TaxID=455488 RepID=B8J4Z5_ANAD2|nr:ATP-grasp domain-containing protein [Anaeromyxobacter dehalogenans]ACL64850.1 D-alanine--D-alanine ligase [Anaeromyxobacter dehalogenans 2CP-1]
MRIALTHNLRISDSEEEAEFDTRETVDALAGAIERLGHRVERIEVSGPASRTVTRLEAFGPDLIFNTAEGRRGRFREAFFPALFDELGMPYTGSDAYALSVTLDKQLTKLVLAQKGVRTPRWQYVEEPWQLQVNALRYPVIVKPNFEGSSKGITQDSVVDDPMRLHEVVQDGLARYPAGLLVEEFVVGRDLTVPFLEAAAPERHGVLQPVEYVIDPAVTAGRKYAIYDYELKTKLDQAVSVRAPAKVKRAQAERIQQLCETVYRELGIRDLGRIDLRLGDDGELYFLEINALPSLEPGAGIYAAAALEGLHEDAVLGAVIQSAVQRWNIVDKSARRGRPRRTERLKVGFSFNVKRVTPDPGGEQDEEAEYDSPKTLQAIREAIASWGHEVVDLEATQDLPLQLVSTPVDVVFNIAEGFKGRSRESQVPSLLELLDIPYTGSDPAALSVSLDKALAKRMVRTHGILTPDYLVLNTGNERLPRELTFPLIVKPVAEGTSKGVTRKSVVRDEPELREVARELIAKYRQPALAEGYVSGREFTVGLLGERRPRVLPPMEIVFLDAKDPTPIYSFEMKQDWNERIRYEVPAKLTPRELERLEKAARECFTALGCRDVARLDFRMDAEGRIHFIECNPLPGLAPGWSDLVLIAQAAGMDYRALIGEILSFAIRRYQERERERERARRAQAAAEREALATAAQGNGAPGAEAPAGGNGGSGGEAGERRPQAPHRH